MKFHNRINQRKINALGLLEEQLKSKVKTLSVKNAAIHGVKELPLSEADVSRIKKEMAILRARIIYQ